MALELVKNENQFCTPGNFVFGVTSTWPRTAALFSSVFREFGNNFPGSDIFGKARLCPKIRFFPVLTQVVPKMSILH